jgi:hypothetical protein
MEIEFKDNKVIIEIDKKNFNYSLIDMLDQFERKKNKFLEFALQHKGELKNEDIASEEELHVQGD